MFFVEIHVSKENILKEIRNLQNIIKYDLIKIGVRSNLLGFDYLCTAIKYSILFPDVNLCSGIYVMTSKEHNVPYHSVERDIRFAINDLYFSRGFEEFSKFLNLPINLNNTKMTNGRFINYAKNYYLKNYMLKTKINKSRLKKQIK